MQHFAATAEKSTALHFAFCLQAAMDCNILGIPDCPDGLKLWVLIPPDICKYLDFFNPQILSNKAGNIQKGVLYCTILIVFVCWKGEAFSIATQEIKSVKKTLWPC